MPIVVLTSRTARTKGGKGYAGMAAARRGTALGELGDTAPGGTALSPFCLLYVPLLGAGALARLSRDSSWAKVKVEKGQ